MTGNTGNILGFMPNTPARPASAPLPGGGSFEEVVLPHLDAGLRLARLLMKNEHDAEDVLQDASLRAFLYFRTFAGGNGRAWFLRIVRNACTRRYRHRLASLSEPFDEERHRDDRLACDPERLALHADDGRLVEEAMRSLPARSRRVLELRELQGLSYRELAQELGAPLGTVMSSLSRARQAFRSGMHRARQSGTPGRRLSCGPPPNALPGRPATVPTADIRDDWRA